MTIDILVILTCIFFGFALGLAASFFMRNLGSRSQLQFEHAMDHMRSSFSALSLDVLGKSTEQLSSLSRSYLEAGSNRHEQILDAKKDAIGENIRQLSQQIERTVGLVRDLEKDREAKFGEISGRLAAVNEQTHVLASVTRDLRETFATSQARGQWGERIADDVLRAAGFIENINYTRQKTIEGIGTKPDFSFVMPNNAVLNMDVKFPIANYLRHKDASAPAEREKTRRDFFNDVKLRIKEVTARGYISEEQGTLDCVLMFIPNEQIYAFIQAEEPNILDEALRHKVICCSPLTLFAVLAVIRQSIDNFAVERTSREILLHLSEFKRQWEKFIEKFDSMGAKLDAARKEFDSLLTTRRNQLERPLEKLENLRSERELKAAES